MTAGAQVRRFLILHKELDADDGELTRTQKVRRGFVAERYAPLIKALYDGSDGGRHLHRGDLRGRPQGRAVGATCKHPSTWRPIPLAPPSPAGGGRMKADVEPSRASAAHRRRRGAALDRERVAVVRRRARDPRRVVRHHEGRGPRHHRPERRRQDLDAQRHQRLLSPAAGPHHLQGRDAARKMRPYDAAARRHRPHLPERRAVQGHERARQHHGRPHA